MNERYIGLNLTDDEFYIADSSVLSKNKKWFEEKYLEDDFEQNIEDDWCEYLYENSMSGLEIINRLNEQDERIRELEKENKQLKQGKYIYGIHGGSND